MLDLGVDAANGISFFPDPSVARIAVTSGQRHYDLPADMEDEDDLETQRFATDSRNALQVYEFNKKNGGDSDCSVPTAAAAPSLHD